MRFPSGFPQRNVLGSPAKSLRGCVVFWAMSILLLYFLEDFYDFSQIHLQMSKFFWNLCDIKMILLV